MQFLMLLLFNIFMGTILYLIISLKLEKSATEFRSQKLRKEMEEIIKEFNATAERNITILENRITVLQRLLERSGKLRSLDVSVGDMQEQVEGNTAQKGSIIEITKTVKQEEEYVSTSNVISGGGDHYTNTNENGLLSITKKIFGRIREKKDEVLDVLHHRKTDDVPSGSGFVSRDRTAVVIEPELEDSGRTGETVAITVLDEEEIQEMISSADNKYSAISRLYEKGCTLETIARCSGMPVGEVKLVLNLHNSRSV